MAFLGLLSCVYKCALTKAIFSIVQEFLSRSRHKCFTSEYVSSFITSSEHVWKLEYLLPSKHFIIMRWMHYNVIIYFWVEAVSMNLSFRNCIQFSVYTFFISWWGLEIKLMSYMLHFLYIVRKWNQENCPTSFQPKSLERTSCHKYNL